MNIVFVLQKKKNGPGQIPVLQLEGENPPIPRKGEFVTINGTPYKVTEVEWEWNQKSVERTKVRYYSSVVITLHKLYS